MLKSNRDFGPIKPDSRHGQNSDNDDDSSSGKSFEDDFQDEEQLTNQDLSQLRELKLLRERRILRQSQSSERVHLRYHFMGVMLNFSLVGIALLIIVLIAKSGGLCIEDMKPPNVFKMNQLERCFRCENDGLICQKCEEGQKSQCYYPYY